MKNFKSCNTETAGENTGEMLQDMGLEKNFQKRTLE